MDDNKTIRLLVVEESANEAEVIFRSLRKSRYSLIHPRHIEDDEDLGIALNAQEWDLIIAIPEVGDFTIAKIHDKLIQSKIMLPIIVIVGELDGAIIAKMLTDGATQVIPDEDDKCLSIVVSRELEHLTKHRQNQTLEHLYQESQKHNHLLLDSSLDAIAYVQDGIHIYANPSYLKMFDYKSMDDLLLIMDLISPHEQTKFNDFLRDFMTNKRLAESKIELDGLKANEKQFKIKMVMSQANYNNEPCVQVIIHDQSWKQRDPVTGLLNSQYFIQLLSEALVEAKRERSVLFYIALDNFSKIKENIGVGAYEPLIKNIAVLLDKISDGGDFARFSDNVFTLLIADDDGEKYKEAAKFADKLRQTVESSVTELANKSLVVTCSIGITQVLSSAGSPQNILTAARNACKIAQEKGGNRFEIYKISLEKEGSSAMAQLIETAIEEERLSLFYQPIVSLHAENTEIYEVCLRMVDSDGNPVSTGEMFQEAEKHNLNLKLDMWVIRQSVKILVAQIKKKHHTHFFIKLSAQSLQKKEILVYIAQLLKKTKLPGEHLIFEFREAVALNQISLTKAFIKQVNKFKCKTALEHFGKETNFETVLQHLPVNYVKIDASYSKDLLDSEEQQTALKNIVQLTKKTGQQTIAVAVEDANCLAILWEHTIDFAQGHYIQEPLGELEFDFSGEE